jgi:hypothetical protein
MSYQDPNQPYGAPQQPQGQQIPGQGQGQPQGQGQSGGWGQQQGSWGQPGGISQPQNSGPQQNSGQGSWGAHPGQFPMPPQQPNYGAAPGYGQPGQSGPQDYPAQQFNQQQPGYGQGYPGGPQGYMPQTDFGSGAGYGPGYPMPNQGNSGLATTSLWLGILGGWGVVNLVISILAIRETGPGKKLGRNKAITGLVLTIAWAVVWTGIFVAVSDHAKNQLQPVGAPTAPFVATSAGATAGSGATGAAGEQATGASSDPGCQAAQSAFNTYNANAESGGLSAIQTLGNSLVTAAGESRTASSQLKTMGSDFLELADASTPTNMVDDLLALNTACGISFTFSG